MTTKILDLADVLKATVDSALKSALVELATKKEDSKELLLDEPQDGEESVSEADEGSDSIESMITKLNDIRSGHSFKDSAVRKALEDFISQLDDSQKSAAAKFLDGVATIATGNIQMTTKVEPKTQDTGAEPFSPSDLSSTAEKTSTGSGSSEHGKKVVVKKPIVKTASKKSASSEENTEAPKEVPISPKKK